MAQKNALIQLPVSVREPTLHLERAGTLQRVYWSVLQVFGIDVEISREEYQAEQFTRALAGYSNDVANFGTVVAGLREAYTALTTSLREDEQLIRVSDSRLKKSYSLDMRLLGYNTDSEEQNNREFATTEDLEDFLRELRDGLSGLEHQERQQFEEHYGTSVDAYRNAGEYVLGLLETEVLARTDAAIDYNELTKKVETLRARREQIFEAYKNARARYTSYKNLRDLLNVDAQARAFTIQAAAHAERLELGSTMLLDIYEKLAPAEAVAQAELSKLFGDEIDTQYKVLDATVQELKKLTGGEE